MQIKDAMSSHVETIDPEASVQDAARMMKDLGVGLLPVATAKGLIGVLSDRDITVRVTAAGLDAAKTAVHRAMSLGLLACYEHQDVEEATEIMRKRGIENLLVLNNDRRPAGILCVERLRCRHQQRDRSHA